MGTNKKSKPPFLKSKNAVHVITFIIWCLALYTTFNGGFDSFWGDMQGHYTLLSKKNGLVVAMMPVLVLVLSGLVSSSIKANLVFFRLKDPLPGHRAFSKLAPADPRIRMAELRAKIGALPRSPKEQNALWYKLYKLHEGAQIVETSHRSFLLARDLATISLLFAVIGSLGLVLGGTGWVTLAYFGIMMGQFVALAVVASNHGKRMVCNVIVEHLSG